MWRGGLRPGGPTIFDRRSWVVPMPAFGDVPSKVIKTRQGTNESMFQTDTQHVRPPQTKYHAAHDCLQFDAKVDVITSSARRQSAIPPHP